MPAGGWHHYGIPQHGVPLDGIDTPEELPCCDDVDDGHGDDGLPGRAIEAMTAIPLELLAAEEDMARVLGELLDGTAAEIAGATAQANQVMDEVIGATDLVLDEQEAKVGRVIHTLLKGAEKEIDTAADMLRNVGVNVPYSGAGQVAINEGEWSHMMAHSLPRVAAALGYTAADPSDLPHRLPLWDTPGEPATIDDGPHRVPPLPEPDGGWWVPPQPPGLDPPAGPTCPPSSTVTTTCEDGSGSTTINVWVPPPAPPPPAPPIRVDCGDRIGYPTLPPPPPAPIIINPITGLPADPIVLPPIGGKPPSWNWPPARPITGPTPVPPPPVPGGGNTFIDDRDTTNIYNEWASGLAPHPGTPGQPATFVSPYPDVPRAKQEKFDSINWNELEACVKAKRLSTDPLLNVVPQLTEKPQPFLHSYVSAKTGWTSWKQGTWEALFPPAWMKRAAESFGRTETGQQLASEAVANQIAEQTILGNLSPNGVPNRAAAIFFGAKLGGAAFVEGKTGFPLSYLLTADNYLFQYSNPQTLPNQIRVDDAYMGGQITEEQWVCWTRANGNLPEPAKRVMLAGQARPGVADLIDLWRRGTLTEAQLFDRARERGVLSADYVKEWIRASESLPGQPDLIRFMVRDASDDEVAARYGYDSDFSEKYTPQIKAWARSLGVGDDYFKMMWRSHWEIPSYTQLREMFHRLRPDRGAIREWDEDAQLIGPAGAELSLGPRPSVVTREEVEQALRINDLAPRWVSPQVEVSYTPINRTDAIRAYQIGAFDEERLGDAFLDVGYSPRDTATLVDYHRQDKARRRSNVTGTWPVRKTLSYYRRGYIDRAKAVSLLSPMMADKAEVESTLDAADDELSADTRAAAVRGVRRGLVSGEHSDAEAIALLVRFGVDAPVASKVATAWVMDRDTRYKRISAQQAAKMFAQGLIGAEELRRRVRNLGYALRDADLITAKALSVQGEEGGLDPAELDSAIGTTIRNQKDARKRSDSFLSGRLKFVTSEARRLIKELNVRRLAEGKDPLPEPPDY